MGAWRTRVVAAAVAVAAAFLTVRAYEALRSPPPRSTPAPASARLPAPPDPGPVAEHRATAEARTAPAAPQETRRPSPLERAAEAAPGATARLDRDALVDAGVAPRDVERVLERFEATEITRAELEATRRRRRLTPLETQTLRELDSTLEQEIGTDDFDRLRFAQGVDNGLEVLGVLKGGPAYHAGLQPGDIVLRYAGERVDDVNQLMRLAKTTEPGPGLVVVFRRDGQVLEGPIRAGDPAMGMRPVSHRP